MNYELLISTVRDRADLLDETLRSMLPRLDPMPGAIIVHEDVREGVETSESTDAVLRRIAGDFGLPCQLLTTDPGGGLGAAMLRLFEAAQGDVVLYSQEDFETVRRVPVGRAIEIMRRHNLNHIRFNKRKTLAIKGQHRPNPDEWYHKLEVDFDGQTLCVSDQWYFQLGLWRRSMALEGFRAIQPETPRKYFCEPVFNSWVSETTAGHDDLTDPKERLVTAKTFIWGPIGEPAFIMHTGRERRTQVLCA